MLHDILIVLITNKYMIIKERKKEKKRRVPLYLGKWECLNMLGPSQNSQIPLLAEIYSNRQLSTNYIGIYHYFGTQVPQTRACHVTRVLGI